MNDVAELKEYVGIHARGQRIPGYRQLLDRIHTDGEGPGSWVHEWVAAGERLQAGGHSLQASRHYMMARFPFVDGPPRKDAQERAVTAFEAWSRDHGVERLDVPVGGDRMRIWQCGLGSDRSRPLLIVMGGIVSVKEQWAPALPVFARMGMAAVAAEMPGAGENPLRYGPDAGRMLPAILDALADRANVRETYVLGLSFSGHLALRCAAHDPRIRGIVAAGAPVNAFFTDPDWQRGLPRITVDTLAHLTGAQPREALAGLRGCALDDAQLAALDIPVRVIVSRRDEIIPPADVQRLRATLRDLQTVEYDDVHGAPAHAVENQLWCARAVLRMRQVRSVQRVAIGALWRLRRAQARLAGHR